jgi:hypothetical protein
LSKFAVVACTCVVLFCAVCHAQQTDVALSYGTMESPSPRPGVVNFQQPAEKNGVYVGVSADFIRFKRHLGVSVESVWRDKKAAYPANGESYRPFLTDVDLIQQRDLKKRILGRAMGFDLLAGVGLARTNFYLPSAPSCSIIIGGCINYTSSNHFMQDLGVNFRVYPWRHFFFRPEIRYYHIDNNFEFHSANLVRGSVSIGYSFGR